MVKAADLAGPSAAKQAYEAIAMDNREAHKTIDKSMKRLGDAKAEFPLGGATPWKTFCTDVSSFSQASFSVGAGLTTGLMVPLDLAVGRGRGPQKGDSVVPFNEGLAGTIVRGANTGVSAVAEGAGTVGGYIASVVPGAPTMAAAEPQGEAASDVGIQTSEHASKGGNFLGRAVGKNVGGLMGATTAVAMNATRAVSLAVKYVVSGSFAAGGAVVGALFGAGHAIKHAASGKA